VTDAHGREGTGTHARRVPRGRSGYERDELDDHDNDDEDEHDEDEDQDHDHDHVFATYSTHSTHCP
jgi:hypothetical protein